MSQSVGPDAHKFCIHNYRFISCCFFAVHTTAPGIFQSTNKELIFITQNEVVSISSASFARNTEE